MTFDPMSVEVTCVTLPKDHCVQVPWQYINVCGYSDQFCKIPHTYIHTHTTYIHILHVYTYYVQNEWSHSLLLNSVQVRQKGLINLSTLWYYIARLKSISSLYICRVSVSVFRNLLVNIFTYVSMSSVAQIWHEDWCCRFHKLFNKPTSRIKVCFTNSVYSGSYLLDQG